MAEMSEELARSARETRADLMARLGGSAEPLFVTLHPAGLALLEAVLASPARAQQLDGAWLQDELLRTYVELQSPGPLSDLESDPPPVMLADEQGRSSRALYMTVRTERGSHFYRFYFDPLAIDRERERLRLSFELPLGGRPARAEWRLAQATLQGLDELPLVFVLAKQRALRLARWALLRGALDEARSLLDEELSCTPDFVAARQLLELVNKLREERARRGTTPPRRALPLLRAKLEQAERQGLLAELGHNPLADLALRASLLERLLPLGRLGWLPGTALQQATQALETAARHLSAGDFGWGFPAALVDYDTLIAKLLASALDGQTAGNPQQLAALDLAGVAAPPASLVQGELEHRLELANYHLLPRWIKGPAAPHGASTKLSRLQLLELRPVLAAESSPTSPSGQVIGGSERRLGWGWIHSGLPLAPYRVTFADRSTAYWQRAVAQARTEDELKSVARRIIERESYGLEAREVALAMRGLVALRASAVLAELLPVAEAGAPVQAAVALQALAEQRDPRVDAALARAASSTDATVRAAAMRAIGTRGRPNELPLLRRGLDDSERTVAAAALAALLRAADPAALARARAWLTSEDSWQQAQVLEIAARAPRLTLLRRELRLHGQRPEPSVLLPAALVGAIGAGSAPLFTQLYRTRPGLRLALLEHARGRAFLKLFERALGEDEVTLRRSAAARLAELEQPPRALLERARGDADSVVQLTAHTALAQLGEASSLLALGAGARGSCAERRLVVPVISRALDRVSRSRLLLDALQSGCKELGPLVWELVDRYRALDPALARAALGHPQRMMRIHGALRVLGLGAPVGLAERSL